MERRLKTGITYLCQPMDQTLQVLNLPPFPDYELIDSGEGYKLERFGVYITARPEPQALWQRALPEATWKEMAHAWFQRQTTLSNRDEAGNWETKKGMPEQWMVGYEYGTMKLRMRLGLTSFKHVGIFPEQAQNWNFIYDTLKNMSTPRPKVLNLFAYTGGASLAACAAGADVVHVDSVKPVVTWARQNMESSALDGIRWMIEDATLFVQREARRGNQYDAIILDPPAYGRGPKGEKWMLEKNLPEMLENCSKLLHPDRGFVLLNLYSMGFSALVLETLCKKYFPKKGSLDLGELFVADRQQMKLPLGTFARLVY